MKKHLLITTFAVVTSSSIQANQANFTSWYVGGEIGSNKHQLSIPYEKLRTSSYSENFESQAKKSIGLSILGGFGFQFGQSNFIGQIEGKYRFSGGTKSTFNDKEVSKEKANVSIAYLQGYKISENFLPYIKLSLDAGIFDFKQENIPKASYVSIENSGAIGIGLGVGLKYMITDSVTVGIEYHKVT